MATKYPTIMELNEVSKETIQQQYLAASIANCTPKTPFSYSYIFSRLANDRDEIQHWIKDGIADASIQNTGNSNYRIRCKTEVFNMDLKQDYDIDLFISVLAPPWDHESIEVGTKVTHVCAVKPWVLDNPRLRKRLEACIKHTFKKTKRQTGGVIVRPN